MARGKPTRSGLPQFRPSTDRLGLSRPQKSHYTPRQLQAVRSVLLSYAIKTYTAYYSQQLTDPTDRVQSQITKPDTKSKSKILPHHRANRRIKKHLLGETIIFPPATSFFWSMLKKTQPVLVGKNQTTPKLKNKSGLQSQNKSILTTKLHLISVWITELKTKFQLKKKPKHQFKFKFLSKFNSQSQPQSKPRTKPKKSPKKRSWTHRLVDLIVKPVTKVLFPFYYTLRYHWLASIITLIGMTAILGLMFVINSVVFFQLPTPEVLRTPPDSTTQILDRNGVLLYSIYDTQNRTIIPLSDIPDVVKYATIAIEDQDFYYHHGFSLRGIFRALQTNYQNKTMQGGSTITQQLVKNRLLTNEKTLSRKIRELVLSVWVEVNFSKDQILEMYLNQVAYGGATYGIEAASQRFFGKHAKQLNLSEAALLAGLPAAPSVYSPYGPNSDLAFERQREVLRRMVEDHYITPEQAQTAGQQQLSFKTNATQIKAPHFVMYVRDLLAKQYGEDLLEHGGLVIQTTLDYSLQAKSEKVIKTEVDKIRRLRISNGAGLITKPQTGEVLAMVGSANYFDFAHDGQVNVVLRPRQPGSSIKPLTYALAFSQGLTPSSTIEDSPVTYQVAGSPAYSPKNYDGKFHGKVSLREALGSSYNVPAVKLLARLGVNNLLDFGQKMGITTWSDRTRFGLSLTLGGGDVKMSEMAIAYGVLANLGNKVELNPILKITDNQGQVIYQNDCALNHQNCTVNQVLDPRVAYQVTHVLSDNVARTPAFGPYSQLNIKNQQIAVKTGTTNNLRDNWTLGYTSDYLVATWVGNNDNTPMSYVASGVTGASPIWNSLFQLVLDQDKPHTFTVPDGIVNLAVCAQTGTLPCRGCTIKQEVFLSGTEPKTACRVVPSPTPATKTPAVWLPTTQVTPLSNRERTLQGINTGRQ